ncbi:hypothetical protein [Elizabethkingia anophelis]|uniref:hypothetical protein n=1 Tax=Elizabethkingia anophelis TaxID=1117645 RepID=UPI0032098737
MKAVSYELAQTILKLQNPPSISEFSLGGANLALRYAEIKKLILGSGTEVTEEELRGIITILDTIIHLAVKEFVIR